MAAANQVLINQESLSISISGDYGSIISKVARGRRSRSLPLFDVNQLLSIVKNILPCANPQPVSTVNIDTAMVEAIRKLSCKLACSCSIRNAKATVEEIISNNYLSKYDWDVAMVTVLASFATNYGAFRVFVQSSANNNQVFKNISLLKQLPEFEYTRKLVGEIDKVVMAAMEMTEYALKLMELRRANNVQISTALGSVDNVAQAACSAIHIVVICASLITAPADGNVVNDMESIFSNYITQIKTIAQALSDEIKATSQEHDDWQTLVDVFCYTDIPSIAAMLNALIGPDANGRSTLVTGNNTKIEVSFEQIMAKGDNIYLLITGGYISVNEIQYLAELMKKQTKCQLVWIPISIDIERYTEIQCQMNWYTVRHPLQIRTAAIKFIRETWMFQGQTIVVPLAQKEPECVPVDMICAMGYFPGVDSPPPPPLPHLSFNYLLTDLFCFNIPVFETASVQPIICLYGGEDLDWIKSFSKQWGEFSSAYSSKFKIRMEFIYVSKSEGIDAENAKIFDHLNTTKFGYSWKAETMECWRFWIRVQNFFREQIQMGSDMKKDIMKEALTLLSYNSNRKGWVVFGQYGTDLKLAQATGDIADNVVKQLFNMRHRTSSALMETLRSMCNNQAKNVPHHCSHIMLPATLGDLGDCIPCPTCDKIMTNNRYYRCCV